MGNRSVKSKMSMIAKLLLFVVVIVTLLSQGSCATLSCPTPTSQPADCPAKLEVSETFNTDSLKGAKYDNGAIIRAIKRNDAEVAACLVFEDVDLHYQEPDTGKTPLMYATEYGMETVQRGILCDNNNVYGKDVKEKNIKLQDKNGNTALHIAVMKGGVLTDTSTILSQYLCDYISQNDLDDSKDVQNAAGNTPLILAAELNRQLDIEQLMSGAAADEADKNIQNNNGDTAIMVAARAGNLAVVSKIYDAGANKGENTNLNLKNRLYNQTALMIAARAGYLDIVKFLINKGADPNVRGTLGRTALDFAVSNGYPPVAHFLMDRGAIYKLRGTKVSSI